ncbi:MAG: hypothetical protein NZ660_06680 [Oscillatoriaceae bacterium SKYG93]|nr:hypothetical protein [Oscillatoriaceae bacterium SKYG93]MDW8453121.1 hypothetical protein [Oscillatoriaceae cyanobacterium SKYGB_i_bin93]HIK28968.1 hypothetical protein [Oscillatoriaceae cyanobacterium M7585_C2015_266]
MQILLNKISQKPVRIVCALLLSTIAAAEKGALLEATAVAKTIRGMTPNTQRSDRLPQTVANAVRRDLSQQTGISRNKLSIIDYSRQTWPNGCLGIPKPGEMCTQALVEGWKVVVSDGTQEWIYRTDNTGSNVRLFISPDEKENLPKSVANAVKRDLARRIQVPTDLLRIERAERRKWLDSCLGIPDPVTLCTQVLTPGWQVTVALERYASSSQQRWVYRTNKSGSVVKLDESATIQPRQIPKNELPPALARNVVFRALVSGGIAGRSFETTLMQDGRVIQTQITGSGMGERKVIRRLSQQQVREFQRLLEESNFDRYDRLDYLPAPGSADYTTITLTSTNATIRYADIIQDLLPKDLRQVIEAWNKVLY